MSDQRNANELADVDVSFITSCGDTVCIEPSDAVVPILTDTGTVAAGTDTPPRLPTGQIIDSKNTLQSFAATNPLHPSSSPKNNQTAENAGRGDTGTDVGTRISEEATGNNEDTICIAEAVVVQSIANAEVFTPNAETNTSMAAKHQLTVALLVAVMILVVVAVVIGIVLSQKKESTYEIPSLSPVEAPIKVKNQLIVTEFINNITLSGKNVAVNGTDPESKALTWILSDDIVFNETSFASLSSGHVTNVSLRVRQRYALAALWFLQEDCNGFPSKKWSNNGNWLQVENPDECSWYGISCQDSVAVTSIDFFDDEKGTSNDIKGVFPLELCLLGSLEHLDFFLSSLTGSIPTYLGLLTRLTYLNLGGNMLTGMVPESIGRCTGLEYFSLLNCGLIGTLPSSIGQWTNLTYFNCNSNSFSGSLPESIGQWTALVSFDMYSNQLNGTLPQSIGQWSSLSRFAMNSNALNRALPESIVAWKDLVHFDISTNSFSGTLPSLIGQWTSLTYFDMEDNEISGTLPESIANWTAVTSVVFSNNTLTGSLPVLVGNWKDVGYFSVDSNMLNGTISQSLGNWSQLYLANFSNNDFTGTWPPEICRTVEGNFPEIEVDCELFANCSCCTYCYEL